MVMMGSYDISARAGKLGRNRWRRQRSCRRVFCLAPLIRHGTILAAPRRPVHLWTNRPRRTICRAPFQRKPSMFLLARDRALIALTGVDRQAYLQGLVSNDVAKASPERALYAAFLTPQGKYLHDIFIASLADRLLLECEAARRPGLLRRLSL